MTHAMRSASLASALEAGAVNGKAPGGIVAVDGEIASVDSLDELIETIPRLALMVCSATAAELMEVDSGGTLKLLSRSGADVETTCPRMQIPLGQLGRNLVLIVWGPPGTAISERDLEQLTAYSSLAGASLAGRAGAVGTLRSVSSAKSFARKPAHSDARYTFDDLIGDDPAFREALEIARRVSQSDVPILITGESGTGKEMFAQAIHNGTPGTAPTFVGVNVAAIPRELLESELFGYEKGAFTGARNSGHAGKFEVAGRGTLLLDEIGDMPMEMQTRLLRVLQERVVQRLGSARNIPLHARVIATSHRDLEEAVADGTFRLDLFHRLRVVHLKLPSLRQRRGDVPLLVEHYLRRYAERLQRTPIDVAPDVMAQLERYDWPGNVRELANLIEGEASLLPLDQNVIRRVPASIDTVRRPATALSSRPATRFCRSKKSSAELTSRPCSGTVETWPELPAPSAFPKARSTTRSSATGSFLGQEASRCSSCWS